MEYFMYCGRGVSGAVGVVEELEDEDFEEVELVGAGAYSFALGVELADGGDVFDDLPGTIVGEAGLDVGELAGPFEAEFGHEAAVGFVGGVEGGEQVGEEIEEEGCGDNRLMVLGVAAEVVDDFVDAGHVAAGDGGNQFEVVVVFADADVALHAFGGNHGVGGECDGHFADFVVDARQVGAYVVLKHCEGLVVNGEAALLDEFTDGVGDGCGRETFRLKNYGAAFGKAFGEGGALDGGTAGYDDEQGGGNGAFEVGEQLVEPCHGYGLRFLDDDDLTLGHHGVALAGFSHGGGVGLRRVEGVLVEVAFRLG